MLLRCRACFRTMARAQGDQSYGQAQMNSGKKLNGKQLQLTLTLENKHMHKQNLARVQHTGQHPPPQMGQARACQKCGNTAKRMRQVLQMYKCCMPRLGPTAGTGSAFTLLLPCAGDGQPSFWRIHGEKGEKKASNEKLKGERVRRKPPAEVEPRLTDANPRG